MFRWKNDTLTDSRIDTYKKRTHAQVPISDRRAETGHLRQARDGIAQTGEQRQGVLDRRGETGRLRQAKRDRASQTGVGRSRGRPVLGLAGSLLLGSGWPEADCVLHCGRRWRRRELGAMGGAPPQRSDEWRPVSPTLCPRWHQQK